MKAGTLAGAIGAGGGDPVGHPIPMATDDMIPLTQTVNRDIADYEPLVGPDHRRYSIVPCLHEGYECDMLVVEEYHKPNGDSEQGEPFMITHLQGRKGAAAMLQDLLAFEYTTEGAERAGEKLGKHLASNAMTVNPQPRSLLRTVCDIHPTRQGIMSFIFGPTKAEHYTYMGSMLEFVTGTLAKKMLKNRREEEAHHQQQGHLRSRIASLEATCERKDTRIAKFKRFNETQRRIIADMQDNFQSTVTRYEAGRALATVLRAVKFAKQAASAADTALTGMIMFFCKKAEEGVFVPTPKMIEEGWNWRIAPDMEGSRYVCRNALCPAFNANCVAGNVNYQLMDCETCGEMMYLNIADQERLRCFDWTYVLPVLAHRSMCLRMIIGTLMDPADLNWSMRDCMPKKLENLYNGADFSVNDRIGASTLSKHGLHDCAGYCVSHADLYDGFPRVYQALQGYVRERDQNTIRFDHWQFNSGAHVLGDGDEVAYGVDEHQLRAGVKIEESDTGHCHIPAGSQCNIRDCTVDRLGYKYPLHDVITTGFQDRYGNMIGNRRHPHQVAKQARFRYPLSSEADDKYWRTLEEMEMSASKGPDSRPTKSMEPMTKKLKSKQ